MFPRPECMCTTLTDPRYCTVQCFVVLLQYMWCLLLELRMAATSSHPMACSVRILQFTKSPGCLSFITRGNITDLYGISTTMYVAVPSSSVSLALAAVHQPWHDGQFCLTFLPSTQNLTSAPTSGPTACSRPPPPHVATCLAADC